jgi:hypothetical protein
MSKISTTSKTATVQGRQASIPQTEVSRYGVQFLDYKRSGCYTPPLLGFGQIKLVL